MAAGFYTDWRCEPRVPQPFTPAEIVRLAAYTAAVVAGVYGEWSERQRTRSGRARARLGVAAVSTDTGPTFGELLRDFRQKAGLTQAELAERAGLAVRGIADLERGVRLRPYRDTIRRLAEALHLAERDRAALAAAGRRASRALAGPRSPDLLATLPVWLTSFVGREHELAEVLGLLETSRLVTLTGPGGSGKTRLALEAARTLGGTFANGVTFVDLAPISDPALVVSALAQALGVREAAGQPLLASVQAALHDQHRLLVLDNFEQILPAAPLVTELLCGGPLLRALVTSRAPLHLSGEQEYPVPPLALPTLQPLPSLAQLAQVPAVALFVQRARAVKPDFRLAEDNARTVAQLCVQLDGLPLVLELAAARIKVLSPAGMLALLQQLLDLLTGGPRDRPARHQTLRAAIGWSHDLLEPAEQVLFRRLAVFAGGWTLQAAEAVFAEAGRRPADVLDTLGSLVDWNLLQAVEEASGERRFGMLETIRDFAEEQLEHHGEAESVRRRFAEYFVDLATQTEPRLSGSRQVSLLNAIELEYANLRAVLQWLLKHGDVATGLRLAGALWRFWYLHSYYTEGRHWLEEFLSLPSAAAEEPASRATALNGLGSLAYNQADFPSARRWHEESLTLRRDLNDEQGIAGSLNNLGLVLRAQGEAAQAADYFREALEINRRLGNRAWMAINLNNLGNLARDQRRFEEAAQQQRESLATFEALEDAWGKGMALCDLAYVRYDWGELDDAARGFELSLAICDEVGDQRGAGLARMGMAYVHIDQGRYTDAHKLLTESLDISTGLRALWGTAKCLEAFGVLAAARGQLDRAEHLIRAAASVRRRIGAPRSPNERHTILRHMGSRLAGGSELELALTAGDEGLDLEKVIAVARVEEEPEPSLPPKPIGRSVSEAGAGPRRFAAVWAEGRGMALEQAIEYALATEEAATPAGAGPGASGPAHPARARGGGAACAWADQPSDRPGAGHQREDRRHSC